MDVGEAVAWLKRSGTKKTIDGMARYDRNFVKKGVSWALRAIGRRSPKLRVAALALAERLAASKDEAARWVGKDALRDLHGAAARKKMIKMNAAGG